MNSPSGILLCLVAAIGMTGCNGAPPDEPAGGPVALVEMQPAAVRSVEDTLGTYGTTEFVAASAASLTVQVEMQVASVLVTSGMQVRRDQALLQLAPSRMTGLALGKARRDADLALAESNRVQRLRGEGLATESELLAANDAANTAVELRDSLNARVGSETMLTLRAPRDGIIDALSAQPGDILVPGAVAVRIAAPDDLQVRLGVEPEDSRRVAAGQPVVLVPLTPGATPVQAVVTGVDRRVDPQTRLIAVLVRLPQNSGLLPGATLRAQIVVATRPHALTVPQMALLYEGERPYLFVAQGNKARRREVAIGVRDGDDVEVTSGVAAGELVIVTGNSVLEDGMEIRTAAVAAQDPPSATGTKQ